MRLSLRKFTICTICGFFLVGALGCSGAAKKKPAHHPHPYNFEFRGVVDGKCTVAKTGTDSATGKTIIWCLEGARQ